VRAERIKRVSLVEIKIYIKKYIFFLVKQTAEEKERKNIRVNAVDCLIVTSARIEEFVAKKICVETCDGSEENLPC
jgi:hypothetical protein